jgi:hypothetical protein
MRWWCRFIDSSGLPLFLFDKGELPLKKAAQERVETQLLLFVMFLCRIDPPILGITIDAHVGHVKVKAVHVRMANGMAFKDVLVCSQRLKSSKQKLKALRPSSSRTKIAFEAGDYKKCVAGAKREKGKPRKAKRGRKASTATKKKSKQAAAPKEPRDVDFLVDRVVLGVSVAMTALLQPSELVDNKYKSAADRAPIVLSDLCFVRKKVSGDEVDIEVNEDGSLAADACHLDRIECRMPPSKSDRIQRTGNELIFPCTRVR